MQQGAVALSTSGSRAAPPNEGRTTFRPPRRLWYQPVQGGGHIPGPHLPSQWSARPRFSSATKPRAWRRRAFFCATMAGPSRVGCAPYKNSESGSDWPRPHKNEHLLGAVPTVKDNSPAPQSPPPQTPPRFPISALKIFQNTQPRSDPITGSNCRRCNWYFRSFRSSRSLRRRLVVAEGTL